MSVFTETMGLEFIEISPDQKLKEKEKQAVVYVFKECGLSITTKANLKVVRF